MPDTTTKLREFLRANNISANEASVLIRNFAMDDANDKIKQTVADNASLVKRCFVRTSNGEHGMFPAMKQYLKVISARSTTPYRVECLVFDETPTYWFDLNATKIGQAGDYYLGTFDFTGIHTESVMVQDIKALCNEGAEINLVAYNNALRAYMEDLIALPWICDHYRHGNTMPTDDKFNMDIISPI